jgi:hypothetical protein
MRVLIIVICSAFLILACFYYVGKSIQGID